MYSGRGGGEMGGDQDSLLKWHVRMYLLLRRNSTLSSHPALPPSLLTCAPCVCCRFTCDRCDRGSPSSFRSPSSPSSHPRPSSCRPDDADARKSPFSEALVTTARTTTGTESSSSDVWANIIVRSLFFLSLYLSVYFGQSVRFNGTPSALECCEGRESVFAPRPLLCGTHGGRERCAWVERRT